MSASDDTSRKDLELLARYYRQQGLNELAQEIITKLREKDQHNVVDIFENEERRA
jgi:hypothetical protein